MDGGPPRAVVDLRGDRICRFAWSQDGRLAVAHGNGQADVVLSAGMC